MLYDVSMDAKDPVALSRDPKIFVSVEDDAGYCEFAAVEAGRHEWLEDTCVNRPDRDLVRPRICPTRKIHLDRVPCQLFRSAQR